MFGVGAQAYAIFSDSYLNPIRDDRCDVSGVVCPPGSLKKRDLFPAACEFTTSLAVICARVFANATDGSNWRDVRSRTCGRRAHGKCRARCREDIPPPRQRIATKGGRKLSTTETYNSHSLQKSVSTAPAARHCRTPSRTCSSSSPRRTGSRRTPPSSAFPLPRRRAGSRRDSSVR
jgi:hypothetical protein